MMEMTVIVMTIVLWEFLAGTPSTKVSRKKTTYLPMGVNNTNRVSYIFKPRENIATFFDDDKENLLLGMIIAQYSLKVGLRMFGIREGGVCHW